MSQKNGVGGLWGRPRALEGYCLLAFRAPGGQRVITERERACEVGDPLLGPLSWMRWIDTLPPKKTGPKKRERQTGGNKASSPMSRLRAVMLTWRGPNRPCRVSGGGQCKSRPGLYSPHIRL